MSHKNCGIINFSTIRIAAAVRYEKFSHHSIAAVIFSATLMNFQLISNFNHESRSIIKFCSKNSVFRILLLPIFFCWDLIFHPPSSRKVGSFIYQIRQNDDNSMSKQCYHVYRNFSILIFIVHHSQSRWNNKNISSSSVASINENDTQLSMNCSIMTLIVNYHLHRSLPSRSHILEEFLPFPYTAQWVREDSFNRYFVCRLLLFCARLHKTKRLSELTIIRITNHTHTWNTPSGSWRCD